MYLRYAGINGHGAGKAGSDHYQRRQQDFPLFHSYSLTSTDAVL